jgi:shikimate kinase
MVKPLKGIILYGMMGCGKSTLGKRLAALLNIKFVDTDELIEQRFGQTCADLIEAGNFDKQQAEVIMAYAPIFPEVIATGGSVASNPQLLQRLAKLGVGIFIDVDPKVLRTRLSKERMATLNNPYGLSFEHLYKERATLYETAALHTLRVDRAESVDTTLYRIITLLKQHQ